MVREVFWYIVHAYIVTTSFLGQLRGSFEVFAAIWIVTMVLVPLPLIQRLGLSLGSIYSTVQRTTRTFTSSIRVM